MSDNGKETGLKIAYTLAAIALSGALTMQSAMAEETGSTGAAGSKTQVGDTRAKVGLPAEKHLHRWLFRPAKGSKHTVRNAIGETVPEGRSKERPDDQHVHTAPVVPGPVAPALPGGVPGHLATTAGHIELRAYHPTTTVIAPNRGTIGGLGLIRRGSGASGIGGPATVTVGISGSTIRPKY